MRPCESHDPRIGLCRFGLVALMALMLLFSVACSSSSDSGGDGSNDDDGASAGADEECVWDESSWNDCDWG